MLNLWPSYPGYLAAFVQTQVFYLDNSCKVGLTISYRSLGPACKCFSQGKKQPAISKYFTLIFLVSQLPMMSVTDADLLNLYFSLTSGRKYDWTLLFQVYPCDCKLLAFSSCHRFLPQAPCSPVKKQLQAFQVFQTVFVVLECKGSKVDTMPKDASRHSLYFLSPYSQYLVMLV